jgi:riboflavin synthase
MFTGIVEEIGHARGLQDKSGSWILAVEAQQTLVGTRLGDSIAVNGVCLTVTELLPGAFTFGLAPETLARTNLGDLKPGDGVNLERSMAADGRFGGHYMQGHVDGTGVLVSRQADGDSLRMAVQAPPALMRYLVPKGYVAIDGTSLTLIDVLEDRFTFMLVAYTQQHIVLPRREIGSRVNLEVDVMAKYVERLLRAR